jgi:hypothetical protein
MHIIDKLQRLRANYAVKDTGRCLCRIYQVEYHRRAFETGLVVQDIALSHPIVAIARRVIVLVDLEHVAADVRAATSNKLLDIYSIDWFTAVEAPIIADGRYAFEVAKINLADGRKWPALE